jgi:hypothetical protein
VIRRSREHDKQFRIRDDMEPRLWRTPEQSAVAG